MTNSIWKKSSVVDIFHDWYIDKKLVQVQLIKFSEVKFNLE